MKIAYFDCAFGAAGDMLVGALIAAGAPIEKIVEQLETLNLPPGSFRIRVEQVHRCSVYAHKFEVDCLVNDGSSQGHSHESKHEHEHEHTHGDTKHTHSHSHDHEHSHESRHSHSHENEPVHEHEHTHDDTKHTHSHSHDHEHAHESGHSHAHENGHTHEHNRNLPQILELIEGSKISAAARRNASAIFQKLGEAEAKVHGMSLDEVHFHEVGAIDAIVDIVGFAIAYDLLGIEKSVVSPLPVGSGRVKTQHGLFPVPAPATLNLLQSSGIPVADSPFKHECLTPTGAAILSTVCERAGTMPAMRITASGFGAGTFNPAGFPNVCRAVIGIAQESSTAQSASGDFNSEVVAVLETNLDDLSPQIIAFTMEKLFEEGALDVSITPVVMKKGRSGHVLSVVCKPADRSELQNLIMRNTSTLGVRSYQCERLVAEREWQEITLGQGQKIRIKVARNADGAVVNAQPEYEDCAQYAKIAGLPLKQVIADALTHLSELS